MTETNHSGPDQAIILTEITDFTPLTTVEGIRSVSSQGAAESGSTAKSIRVISISHPSPNDGLAANNA